jgi:hypothetical protein
MSGPKLGHVFGVSKQRVLSYLEREAVDGLFKKALASDCHIVVYGSSKQGKTSLVDKNLPYNSNVVVSCTPKFQAVDIYSAILRAENIYIESQVEKGSGTESKVGVGAKFKATIPFFGGGEAKVDAETSGKSNKTVKLETIETNLELPQDVHHLLARTNFNKFVILENFHYLNLDVQKALAFDLRSFQELGMRFVILGVWREKNRLTQYNGDLQDRILEVPVEPWSESEFREVIALGCDQLNILIAENIQKNIFASAFDSIGVVQELVKCVCESGGISERQDTPSKIDSIDFFESAVREKVEDYSSRHLRALESIAEGRKTKRATEDSVPLYLPYYTVRAWMDFPFNEVVKGIRREILEGEIKKHHHRPDDVRPSDMSNLLHNFAELQMEKGIIPPIFDYDQSSRMMRVIDSTFYFFLRHVDRDAVKKNLQNPIERRAQPERAS